VPARRRCDPDRPAAQADLGRSGGVPGLANDVFVRKYRIATSTNATFCAADAVEPLPGAKTPVTGDPRECR
ncbi:MAG TPA: hypothetical protein VM491_24680, partial [Burkholderiaceae bacterium]|nr:hypothetical protein [Burkholderiaceae bacterium]